MMQANRSITLTLTLLLAMLSWGCNPSLKKEDPDSANDKSNRIYKIVELTGNVTFKRQKMKQFRPVSPYMELSPGDSLKLASGTKVRIACNPGDVRPVTPGRTTAINEICPPLPPTSSDGTYLRPYRTNLDGPYTISPRATNLLTKKPTLRWNKVNADSFTVKVTGSQLKWVKVFEQDEVCQENICEVIYPGNPPLQPGVQYRVVVSKDKDDFDTEDSTMGIEFELIAQDKARKVQTKVQQIQNLDLPDESRAIVLSDLYAQFNLIAEAIETLEKLVQAKKIAHAYRLLGDLYQQSGLFREAGTRYREAVKLAESQENLEELAEAKVGLAKVSYKLNYTEDGIGLLEEAKAIYKKVGDIQRVNELKKQLTDWKKN